MSILTQIGTSEATFNEATGAAATAAFELLTSGAYPATIKSVLVYTNEKFGGTMMKYIVNITESDRDLEFRQDIGAKLKPGSDGVAPDNLGYASRLKQFCFAAGVELDTLSLSPTPIKHKIFGKDTDATQILGYAGKPVLALVRLSEDTSMAEDAQYRQRNDLEGVCAMNGTEASGEDAKALFLAKADKTPVFKFKGKAKAATAGSADAPMSADAKAAAASLI
jgi:hypothetical protein